VFEALFDVDDVALLDAVRLGPDVDHPGAGEHDVEFVFPVGGLRLRVGVAGEFDAHRLLAQHLCVTRPVLLESVGQFGGRDVSHRLRVESTGAVSDEHFGRPAD
jgi:hypothetical protein